MSFIRDSSTGDDIDTHGAAYRMNDVRVTTAQQDAAWATIQRHCPDDADLIGRMLGVTT